MPLRRDLRTPASPCSCGGSMAAAGGTQTRSEGSLFPRILSEPEPLCLCPRLVLPLGLLHSLSRHPCLVSASSPEIPGHAGELSLDLSLTFPSSHDLETATSATLTQLPVWIGTLAGARRALLLFRFSPFLGLFHFSAAFLSCRPRPPSADKERRRSRKEWRGALQKGSAPTPSSQTHQTCFGVNPLCGQALILAFHSCRK